VVFGTEIKYLIDLWASGGRDAMKDVLIQRLVGWPTYVTADGASALDKLPIINQNTVCLVDHNVFKNRESTLYQVF
jgi:hypothetical protein